MFHDQPAQPWRHLVATHYPDPNPHLVQLRSGMEQMMRPGSQDEWKPEPFLMQFTAYPRISLTLMRMGFIGRPGVS